MKLGQYRFAAALAPLLWFGAGSATQLDDNQPNQPRHPHYGAWPSGGSQPPPPPPPPYGYPGGQVTTTVYQVWTQTIVSTQWAVQTQTVTLTSTQIGQPAQTLTVTSTQIASAVRIITTTTTQVDSAAIQIQTQTITTTTTQSGSAGQCSGSFNISPPSTSITTFPSLPITSLPQSLSTISTSSIVPPTISPSSVVPSCTPVPSGPNPQKPGTPNFTFDELYKLQVNFLDNFMYPRNVIQAQQINSSLFADNILGRVDVTRTFDGPELNTEYLFGLFATLSLNPEAISLLGYPINYTITHFAANQNIASASTIISFNFASLGLIVPVEIDTWNLFDADGKILEYDATFRWFNYLYDYLFAQVAPRINATTPAQVTGYFTRALATGICRTHQDYCNGTNLQYSSYNACYDFITKGIRFGTSYELGMNTTLCRMVHQNMVPYRPEVHCPHIGPSGGGMCVDDYTYPSKVLEPFFTEAPFVPYGYQNANATLAAM